MAVIKEKEGVFKSSEEAPMVTICCSLLVCLDAKLVHAFARTGRLSSVSRRSRTSDTDHLTVVFPKALPLYRALTRSLCSLMMTLSLFQISADTPSDQQRILNVLQMSQRKKLNGINDCALECKHVGLSQTH